MTVAEAAKTWAETKRQIDALKPKLETSAEVLKEYFRKTERSNYRGLIGYAKTVRKRLDTKKVKAELGGRLEDFQVPSTAETLSLLK